MWRHIILCSFMACGVVVFGFFNEIISKGIWLVDKIDKCPDSDQFYDYKFGFRKKKLNRTHDGFDLEIDFPTDVNKEEYGVYIEACKKVDGGCKIVQIFEDKSFCKYIMKYAKNNFQRALGMMGLEEDCPVPKGSHRLLDFPFDPHELPEYGMTGQFSAKAYLVKDGEKLCCIMVDITFKSDEIEYDI